MYDSNEVLRSVGERAGMLILCILAVLATSIIMDMIVGLDGRTVQGDAVIIASSILVGATMLWKPGRKRE